MCMEGYSAEISNFYGDPYCSYMHVHTHKITNQFSMREFAKATPC